MQLSHLCAEFHLFNQPEHVLVNNCYCFASNSLADVRYALPGRAGGAASDLEHLRCHDRWLARLSWVHMTAVEVEIDVFSGMPNPIWTLSQADAVVFLSKRSELQKTAARPRSTKLGYRGLFVRLPQEAGREIYIQNGVAEVNDQSSLTFFLDPQRSLERWLIETGKRFLSPETLEAIEKDSRN
jgi:hypothetical protein